MAATEISAAHLPQEAIAALFSVLPLHEAAIACQVCKSWSVVGSSDEVWRRRLLESPSAQKSFSSRAQINELLRAVPSDLLIPYREIESKSELEFGSESNSSTSPVEYRLFWREIFFLSHRVQDAILAANKARSTLLQLPVPPSPLPPGPLQDLRAKISASSSSGSELVFSIKFAAVNQLLSWIDSIISSITSIEADEFGSDQYRLLVTKSCRTFQAQLVQAHFLLFLEVSVQLCRSHQTSASVIASFFREHATQVAQSMWISHVSNLGSLSSLCFRQLARIISALSVPGPNFRLSALADFGNVFLEWCASHSMKIAHVWESDLGGPVAFLRASMDAYATNMNAKQWEERLDSILAEIERQGGTADRTSVFPANNNATSRAVAGLTELDYILEQIFSSIPAEESIWQIYKRAVVEFDGLFHLRCPEEEEWRRRIPPLRLLAVIGPSCTDAILEDMDFYINSLLLPATKSQSENEISNQNQNQTQTIFSSSSVTTWRKTVAMVVAHLAFSMQKAATGGDRDGGNVIVIEYLPRLLSIILPLSLDPAISDYVRSCSINLWTAVENLDFGTERLEKSGILALGERFVLDAIEIIEARRGEWSASALALGFAGSALKEKFLPYYQRAIRAIFNSLSVSMAQLNQTTVVRCCEAVMILVQIPPIESPLHQEAAIDEFSEMMIDFFARGLLQRKHHITMLALAAVSSVVSPSRGATLTNSVMPLILEVLYNPPSTLDPEEIEGFNGFDTVMINGEYRVVSTSELSLRESAVKTVEMYCDRAWHLLWPKYFTPLRIGMENVINNEFDSVRIGRAVSVLVDLITGLFDRVSSDGQDNNDHDLRVELEAAAGPNFAIVMQTLLAPREIDGTTLKIMTESIAELLKRTPTMCAAFLDAKRMFDWFMMQIRALANEAFVIRQEAENQDLAGSDAEDEDEDEDDEDLESDEEENQSEEEQEQEEEEEEEEEKAEGPNQDFERRVENDTFAQREASLWMYQMFLEATRLCPNLLDLFLQSNEWRNDQVISDPVGATFALSVIVALLEKCSRDELDSFYDDFVELLLEGCRSPSPYVVQCAVCGLGIAAGVNSETFQMFFLTEALYALDSIWSFPDARNDYSRWLGVLENVSSAYGKILRFTNPEAVGTLEFRRSLLWRFMGFQPFIEDSDERIEAARSLAALIERDDPVVELIKQFPDLGRTVRDVAEYKDVVADPKLCDIFRTFCGKLSL